jgi:hypothetical protein
VNSHTQCQHAPNKDNAGRLPGKNIIKLVVALVANRVLIINMLYANYAWGVLICSASLFADHTPWAKLAIFRSQTACIIEMLLLAGFPGQEKCLRAK